MQLPRAIPGAECCGIEQGGVGSRFGIGVVELHQGLKARVTPVAVAWIRKDAVALDAGKRGYLCRDGLQRLRRLHTDIERFERVSLLVNEAGYQFPQPSFTAIAAEVQRLPDVHRLEVREALVGIANALDDRQVSIVPEFLKRLQVGMKAQARIEWYYLCLWNS